MHTLAQITPVRRGSTAIQRGLNGREKAAVIVRLLLAEGTTIPLSDLPEHLQSALAEQIGQMRLVDRTTLSEVIEEFMAELEQVGLAFPGGIDGALTIMDGHISANAANRLRRLAGASSRLDPWERIVELPPDRLLPVLEEESTEVAAVMLSKLPVPKAAELLGRMPGEKARRVAYAISLTGNVDPETVRRICVALAQQLDTQPARAFETGPVERVGAILNISPAATRDEVLRGLEQADATFAEHVKRAIFTFAHIPTRVSARDVAKVLRLVDQGTLVTALAAAAQGQHATVGDFLLANMSQRMAQSLREEIGERGKVKEKDGEEAMAGIIMAVRQLEAAGEIQLVKPED